MSPLGLIPLLRLSGLKGASPLLVSQDAAISEAGKALRVDVVLWTNCALLVIINRPPQILKRIAHVSYILERLPSDLSHSFSILIRKIGFASSKPQQSYLRCVLIGRPEVDAWLGSNISCYWGNG